MRNWILTSAAIAAAVLTTSMSHASTYTISTTSIDDFIVSGATVSGWTFSQNIAINGTTVLSNGDSLNAPGSCIDCSYDDSYNSHGTATSYTYSDSIISSTDMTGTGGSAASIAEIFSDNGISGSAMSSNSMSGSLTVLNDGLVSFNFDINYYLEVIANNSDTGLSSFSFDLGLYDLNNDNLLSAYNDANLFIGIGPNDDSASSITSGSIDIQMVAGTYRLDIDMTQNVASTVSAVPVPAAAWLFGSGLIGLIGIARRKKA